MKTIQEFSDDELVSLGFSPYHFGERVDAAIVQADHQVYAQLQPFDLPQIKSILDGRNILRAELWIGVNYRKLGCP